MNLAGRFLEAYFCSINPLTLSKNFAGGVDAEPRAADFITVATHIKARDYNAGVSEDTSHFGDLELFISGPDL